MDGPPSVPRLRLDIPVEQTALQLTENIPVGTYVMQVAPDGSPRFTFVSSRWLEMLQRSREEVLADPYVAFKMVHPEEYDAFVALNLEVFEKKLPFYWEGRVVVGGETRWYSAESIPRDLPDGGTVWEGVMIDISARKRSEAELVAHRQHLEELVEARTAELARANGVLRAAAEAREQALVAAERLARLRSEFIASMSHEIRTPLNAVLGFAEIGRLRTHDPHKSRASFEHIVLAGRQLLGVLNDILDFSKLEAGKLGVERVTVRTREVIGEAVDAVSALAEAKRLPVSVSIEPDVPATFVGDPLRIGQILLNLLSNAVKFTDRGGVTLRAERRGDRVAFLVVDTGIGFAPEQAERIFRPFEQGDGSMTRRFGGTGLGLAIVARLLDLMGGDVKVESRPGEGSRFEITLPAAPTVGVAEATVALPPLVERPLRGLRLLVAEDEPMNQAVIANLLVEDGAFVTMVGDGLQAVARATEEGADWDVVLMDLQMPVLDGFEATRRILAARPGLPIIGQTAFALAEDRARCFEAGMVGHVPKPLDRATLVRAILAHAPGRLGAGDARCAGGARGVGGAGRTGD